jgi:chromosome segregation ATPase
MAGTGTTSTLKALSFLLGVLAITGWGSAVYASKSSGVAQRQLQERVGELEVRQGRLISERDEAKSQLAAAQDEIAGLRAQLVSAQQRLDEVEAAASKTESIRAPKSPAQRQSRAR